MSPSNQIQFQIRENVLFLSNPHFYFGTPIYNIDDMISYVKNSLTKNGFQIMTIEPNWLFIRWDMSGKKILIENGAADNNSKKIVTNNYRSVDTYKPSGSFIYDESSMMGLSDKLHS